MPVVGGCNNHHIHVLSIQKFPKVLVGSRPTACNFDGQIAIVIPHIANSNNIHFGHAAEVTLIHPAHSTYTDAANPNSVIGPGPLMAFCSGRGHGSSLSTGAMAMAMPSTS